MRKLFLLTAILVFTACSADAACTAEELQQKAMTLSTQIQALAQKDSKRFQEVVPEFQKKAQELAGAQSQDMEDVCKYYDEMIARTK